jgi:hypothetical protein
MNTKFYENIMNKVEERTNNVKRLHFGIVVVVMSAIVVGNLKPI